MSHEYDDIVFGKADPDNNISVGDLVTTYHKGWWVVEKIEKRIYHKPMPPSRDYQPMWPDGAPFPSIIHYRKVADEYGTPKLKSKMRKSCCATYCKSWGQMDLWSQFSEEWKEAKYKLENLSAILKELEE